MELLGEKCSCINYRAKQAIEWALDYHIIDITKEMSQATILIEQAKREFEEVVGREPSRYNLEEQLRRLGKELDFYTGLREEIIKLPRCPEPPFVAQ